VKSRQKIKRKAKPILIAVLASWGIFFECLLQVPANSIGHQYLSSGQPKIFLELITFQVLLVFSTFFLKERPRGTCYGLGAVDLCGVFFLLGSG
jgi:uncharacterized protein (DUF486 family)